jgi:hypothetical protein
LAFHHCDKYVRDQLKRRKDLFWLTVSDFPAIVGWLGGFLAHGKAENSQKNAMMEDSCLHHHKGEKQRTLVQPL